MKRKSDEYYKQLSYLEEQQLQAMNEENQKLRKEVYELNINILEKEFDKKDVKNSLMYFLAIPSLNCYAAPSLDHLRKCCKAALHHRITGGL